jgi:hypothetical protein
MHATIEERRFLCCSRGESYYATARQTSLYNNKGAVFSAWSMPMSYLEGNWRYSSVENSVVECHPAGNGVTMEAEKSPL